MTDIANTVRIVAGLGDYPSTQPFGPDQDYPEFQNCPWALQSSSRNSVFEAVRNSLQAMGLDSENFGSRAWNPLSEMVGPGGRVTIKPNMVRHWNDNPDGSWRSVVTHWSVVRPLIDYALLAVGAAGCVQIGDAAHWDCDMEALKDLLCVREIVAHYEETAPGQVSFADFRREFFDRAGPVKTERHALPGDPQGYVDVDLGALSSFNEPALDPQRFCAQEYDNTRTVRAHSNGRHSYLISRTSLNCDLFINVPKLKTHHLLGITVAMKNLVGINGDKNLLPHFRAGFVDEGGDQYPARTFNFALRRGILKTVQPLLISSQPLMKSFGHALGLFHKVGGRNPYAGGSWIGNDTVWRMALDLNRVLLYARVDGSISLNAPARRYLTVVDGIVAGEGEGPMAPLDRNAGVLLMAGNPLACDLVAAEMMGFKHDLLKLITEGRKEHPLPISGVKDLSDLDMAMSESPGSDWKRIGSEGLPGFKFRAPIGWKELSDNAERSRPI